MFPEEIFLNSLKHLESGPCVKVVAHEFYWAGGEVWDEEESAKGPDCVGQKNTPADLFAKNWDFSS